MRSWAGWGLRQSATSGLRPKGLSWLVLSQHGVAPELVILSDDAGQFQIAGFLNALCWIHAERTIHTLLPFSDANREAQAAVRHQIWQFYQDLKAFKGTPSEKQKGALRHVLTLFLPRRRVSKRSISLSSVSMTTSASYSWSSSAQKCRSTIISVRMTFGIM